MPDTDPMRRKRRGKQPPGAEPESPHEAPPGNGREAQKGPGSGERPEDASHPPTPSEKEHPEVAASTAEEAVPAGAEAESAAEEKEPRARGLSARGTNPFIAGLAFLVLAEGAGIAYFYYKYYSQSLVNLEFQGKLEKTKATINQQGEEISRHIDALSKLRMEFVKVETERSNLFKSLEEKQRAIADLEQRLRAREDGEKAARSSLERQEQIAAYLRKRLKESKETEMQLHARLEELARRQSEMEAHIARLGEGTAGAGEEIELKETVVAASSAAPKEISGQILIANEKYRFVIINLGSDDGIAVGDEGVIENDGIAAGTARVKKLYNKMCLADVIQSAQGQMIDKKSTVKFIRQAASSGA